MMLPRFNRALNLRPVRSEKHEITWSNLAQNASTVQTLQIVEGTDTPTTADEVSVGATVKWIYFETNLNGVDNSSGAQVFHWVIYKDPGGALTNMDPATYNQLNKKFILKRGMEMLPDIPMDSGGTVQTKRMFTVKIPPRLRRFDEGDLIKLNYKSTSASGINFCGFGIFKEFS